MFNSRLAIRKGKPRSPSRQRRGVEGTINPSGQKCILQGVITDPETGFPKSCSQHMTFTDPMSSTGILQPVCEEHVGDLENAQRWVYNISRVFNDPQSNDLTQRLDAEFHEKYNVRPTELADRATRKKYMDDLRLRKPELFRRRRGPGTNSGGGGASGIDLSDL